MVIVAAVVAGFGLRGAFYGRDLEFVAVLTGIALAACLVEGRPRLVEFAHPFVLGPIVLALSALASGRANGAVAAALPAAVAWATLAGAFVVVRRATPRQRDLLVAAVLGAGVLVAATGWVGVAFHRYPWALVDQHLWRAASTLTYANATAGLLVLLALVAIDAKDRWRLAPLATFAFLTTSAATLSRGGALAFVVGWAVLAAYRGPRRIAAATVWPMAGALVASVGLLPSMPDTHHAAPLLATVALSAGCMTTAVAYLSQRARRAAIGIVTGCVLAGAIGLGGMHRGAPAALRQVRFARLSVSSPDRDDLRRETMRVALTHPFVGVGPGRFSLAYVSHRGIPVRARFTHNEYLQTFAEQGGAGLAVVVVMAGVGGSTLLRRGRERRHAGIIAALTAFGVHSGLDFLWHLPALPVAAAVLAATTVPTIPTRRAAAVVVPTRGEPCSIAAA
jgi:hypothetical protein